MSTRITLVATLAAVALAAPATPASALSLTIGTSASFANFRPGQTATGAGSLIATALPPWTLTVADLGPGAGHMVKAATGCTGSDAQLTNALTVTVTGSGFTSAGSKAISGTATTVASGSNVLVAAVLATNYSQVIPTSQTMLTGCVYTLTATYTLQ
ncbi:MAG: hypothetical protein QOI98_13 [Solirubrobacteraceae bacterium]|jgi:hypothetical protein|nr:hypothetical protein [Solirubrobacteraceae bacterium]